MKKNAEFLRMIKMTVLFFAVREPKFMKSRDSVGDSS